MTSLDLTINDRYRLIYKLGEGGMGELYLAEDLTMQRQVAVKFIRGALGDPDSYTRLLQRFQREARTLAKLSHPNIVHVHDFGDFDGRPYLVMEYLPGGSLAERMGKPIPWQEACKLAATVAKALAFAHSEGVLHRDIKPSNILFTKSGEPMVSDFGLAHLMDPGGEGDSSYSVSLIGAAQAVGTPAYMAPEQWSGKATEQSDIYSLGVVLFQMLTGQVPYPGKTPGEVVNKQITSRLPAARSLNPTIPTAVESLLEKSLEREPANRVENMLGFASALTGLENAKTSKFQGVRTYGKQNGNRPEKKSVSSSSKPRTDKKLGVVFGALVLLFLAGSLVWVLLFWGGIRIFKSITGRSPTATVETIISTTSKNIDAITPTSWLGDWLRPGTPTPTDNGKIVSTKPATFFSPGYVAGPAPTEEYHIGSTKVGKDGMTLVYVPSGTFTMGNTAEEAYAECQEFRTDCDKDWFTDEEPPHQVTLDAFWIDQTEVTNAMYALCVAAGDCSNPSSSGSYTRNSYYGDPQYANYPVIYVNWNQADDYCHWVERELPTEAQWEYAARGPAGSTYPWGNDASTCDRANYSQSEGSYCVGDTVAVKSFESGKSWVGVYDLAGNVTEWVRDVYASYTSGAVTNPLISSGGRDRVVRGGSWYNNGLVIRSAYRHEDSLGSLGPGLGFRCSLPIN